MSVAVVAIADKHRHVERRGNHRTVVSALNVGAIQALGEDKNAGKLPKRFSIPHALHVAGEHALGAAVVELDGAAFGVASDACVSSRVPSFSRKFVMPARNE
jgi:hypothetical protein